MDFSPINLNDLVLIPESVTALAPYNDVNGVWDGIWDGELYVWEFENYAPFIVSKLAFEEVDSRILGMRRTIYDDIILRTCSHRRLSKVCK